MALQQASSIHCIQPLHNSQLRRRKCSLVDSEVLLSPQIDNTQASDTEITKRVSKYRGVSWHIASGKWRARIKQCHLGYFANERAAGRAYDRAARTHFAEKARLNFPKLGASGEGKKECCGRMCKFCPFDWVNVPK
jgi:hypothetical protein